MGILTQGRSAARMLEQIHDFGTTLGGSADAAKGLVRAWLTFFRGCQKYNVAPPKAAADLVALGGARRGGCYGGAGKEGGMARQGPLLLTRLDGPRDPSLAGVDEAKAKPMGKLYQTNMVAMTRSTVGAEPARGRGLLGTHLAARAGRTLTVNQLVNMDWRFGGVWWRGGCPP